MIIKRNEETIKNFIEKYSSYDELGSLLRKYEIKFNDLMKNGEPSEFEKKKFDIEFNKQVREAQEKIAPKKEELKRLLMTFSQELLLELYNRIENNEVRELIYYQIAKNSGVFYNINIDAETGAIFEKLDNIPLENKQDLLNLRETDEIVKLEKVPVLTLLPIAKEYILKSIDGSLIDAKQKFCEERGLTTETEFQFYKNNMINEKKLSQQEMLEAKMNNIVDNDKSFNTK